MDDDAAENCVAKGELDRFPDVVRRAPGCEPRPPGSTLFDSELAGVFRLAPDGRVLECNQKLARLLGRSSAEELISGSGPFLPASVIESPPAVPAEMRLERQDGSSYWALVSVQRVLRDGAPEALEGALIDITDYKQGEQKFLHLKRLYSVLSHLNQAIVRCHAEDELLREACRVAVEDGGFRMACIGLRDSGSSVVALAASFGRVEGDADGPRILLGDDRTGSGPAERAIRLNSRAICNDIGNDEAMAPWRERALERGYRSSGAFPIRVEGEVAGALNLYAADPGLFDEETVDLLEEVADDVGFALESMRRQALRRAAEDERSRLSTSERAAHAQARAEARFRELLEAAPDGILEIDRNGRILLVNAATERLFGYPRQELLGQPLETLVPEPLRKSHVAWREAYMTDAVRRTVSPDRELHARRKDGSVFPVEVSLSPVQSESGELVTCIVRDVSLRRRAEQAQRESSRQIASILESITDGFYALDREWRFAYLNRRAEQLIARRREDLIGKSIWEEYPELVGSLFHKEYLRAAREGAPLEFTAPHPTGILWANVHVYPSPDGLSVYLQDITERKQLEEQFLQSQKLEALGRLAGGVAHDFNNLLTIIGGYGQMMLESIPSRSPFRNDMEAIVEAADRASALTKQLLAFSRRQMVQPKVFDLNRLVKKMNRMLRRVIGEDIDLRLNLHPDVGRIKADASQIEQVLMNLAVNARDAMPQGGRLSVGTSEVTLEERGPGVPPEVPAGRYVVLTVADTGMGMDAAVRSRVFEPFFTTKAKGKGTGLGLATVYGVVKQSGGDILLDTEPGKGARFRIYLPRVEPTPKAARRGRVSHTAQKGTETVLLVEDDAEVRRLAREMLIAQGYKVLEASDGAEAMCVWEAHRDAIDLLITDVIMPQMSGLQLAERLLRDDPGLRVLYISGYTNDVIERHGFLEHEAHLLAKPFTRDALGATIRQLLDQPARSPRRMGK